MSATETRKPEGLTKQKNENKNGVLPDWRKLYIEREQKKMLGSFCYYDSAVDPALHTRRLYAITAYTEAVPHRGKQQNINDRTVHP